jgi:hypothetical protein
MVTVRLTELDINAIGGALIERSAVLSSEIARLITEPKTPSRDFAIDCNADALRDIVRVQLIIAAALEEPEYPPTATYLGVFEGMDDYAVGAGESVEAFRG